MDQYPADVTQVWSNFTPRTTRVANQKHIVWFGLQYFMREILQTEWFAFFHFDEIFTTDSFGKREGVTIV